MDLGFVGYLDLQFLGQVGISVAEGQKDVTDEDDAEESDVQNGALADCIEHLKRQQLCKGK